MYIHSFTNCAVIPGEDQYRPDLDRGKEEARKKAQKVHKERVRKVSIITVEGRNKQGWRLKVYTVHFHTHNVHTVLCLLHFQHEQR